MQSIIQFLRIFFDSFLSFPWIKAIGIVKIILIIITVLTFIGWIILLPHAIGPKGKFSPKFIYKTKPKKQSAHATRDSAKQAWLKLDTIPPRTAIIEADELITGLLHQMKLPGENFTDRLESLDTESISSTARLRKAHDIKTRIIEDENVSEEDMQEALNDYEAFLKEIGIL